MKVLNLGVRAFTLNKSKASKEICPFRLCQDCLPFLSQYITKRRVVIPNTALLFQIIEAKEIVIAELGDETAIATLVDNGHYILYFEEIKEEIMMMKHGPKLKLMISKEHIDSLNIRYSATFARI